ncbi:MAG: competence/damage-inducible protein A [Planctomycetes bacterium]|nr:competence/damage-inducible protein A [Planctomycetota bacterium]
MSGAAEQTAPCVEILAIGDELIHGRCVDTNSAWLATRLAELGALVARFGVVGDAEADIAAALRDASARADLIVATGGLGPTEDDRTRHAAASAAGVQLAFDDASWRDVETFLASRGRHAGEENRRQALLPRGARALQNRWGTAPGFSLPIGSATLFALPGVPVEMRQMTDAWVAPWLRGSFGARLRPSAHQTLRVLGPSEAALGVRLRERMLPRPDVQVGITAHCGLLTVRIVARGVDRAAAEATAHAESEVVAELCGPELLYRGEQELAEVVVERLRARRLRLATAESCTGGLVAVMLTDVPGSSAVFEGGFVTYSNPRKSADLGVSAALLAEHGAVSEPVAAAMALGATVRTGADVGIGITGIAGPEGGGADKPVGTVCFGLRALGRVATWTRRIPPVSRGFVRERAAYEALGAVLRELSAPA